jgi:glucuronate isomerase
MFQPLVLHPDRFFDADSAIRNVARALYEETRELPLVCPHGHVDAGILAANTPFSDPASLLIVPDHYILRLLYSRGVPLERLGVRPRDRAWSEQDPRRIWQTFADHYYLFRGTPSSLWLDYELHELFEVRVKLDGDSAQYVYDQIAERLASPELRPRALYERFNVEVLATTDAPADMLDAHRAIRESAWGGRVIPTFRPDGVFRIAGAGWRPELERLERAHGRPIRDVDSFTGALEQRRAYFKSLGGTATDHAVLEPFTARLPRAEANAIFQRALDGRATAADQRAFEAHMLMEMARMSLDDGLVMQLHAGAVRDHNPHVFGRFGPDTGADIPVATEYTRNLSALLEAYGNDARLTLVLFTLDESTYARELAPIAGHYPAVRLGPPWWFHDSIEGMLRFRRQVTETAGIYNTAGFNDDTRAFCSIPARHDLARRVDASYLGGLVARHVVDMDDARRMARALACDLARETYRLGPVPSDATTRPAMAAASA